MKARYMRCKKSSLYRGFSWVDNYRRWYHSGFMLCFNNAIRFDAHKVWRAWNMYESRTFKSWCRVDVHIMFEILFIRFDAHKVWCAWTLDELGTFDSWCRIDVHIMFWNIVYDIWCTWCFMCTWWDCEFQAIHIRWRGWKIILVRLANWTVPWALNRMRKTPDHHMHVTWG